MKWITTVAFVFVMWLMVGGSCKKPDDSISGGGKGGMATILVMPEHHGLYVDSCTIYIKYATSDAPANGVYDDSAGCVLNDTIPVATFPNLKKGHYYLYGVGYHAGFAPPYVKGGIPYTVADESVKGKEVYLPTYSYTP